VGVGKIPQRDLEIPHEFSIDYKAVKFNTNSRMVGMNPGNPGNRPFVLGNTINSVGRLGSLRLLIHELMHVHQYQHHGYSYIPQVGRDAIDTRGKTGDEALYYEFDETDLDGKTLDDFYIEQQAEIAAHYYEILMANPNDPRLDDYQHLIDEIRDSEPDNWFVKQWNEEVTSTILVGEALVEGGEIIVETIDEEVDDLIDAGEDLLDDVLQAPYTDKGFFEDLFDFSPFGG